jgi:type IV pilus assembly protein PilM
LRRPENFDVKTMPSPEEVPYNQREDIHITKIDSKFYDDLSKYLTSKIVTLYEEDKKTRLGRLGLDETPAEVGTEGELAGEEGEAVDAAATDTTAADTTAAYGGDTSAGYGADAGAGYGGDGAVGGSGDAGWVIQVDGYHYHNGKEYAATGDELEEFILKRLVHEFETGSIKLPVGADNEPVEFTYQELGLSNPFVISGKFEEKHRILNPEWAKAKPVMPTAGAGYGAGGGGYGAGTVAGAGGAGMAPGMIRKNADGEEVPQFFDAPKYSFKLQLVWREKPLTARLEAKALAEQQALEAAAQEQDNLAVDSNSY